MTFPGAPDVAHSGLEPLLITEGAVAAFVTSQNLWPIRPLVSTLMPVDAFSNHPSLMRVYHIEVFDGYLWIWCLSLMFHDSCGSSLWVLMDIHGYLMISVYFFPMTKTTSIVIVYMLPILITFIISHHALSRWHIMSYQCHWTTSWQCGLWPPV